MDSETSRGENVINYITKGKKHKQENQNPLFDNLFLLSDFLNPFFHEK